MVFAMAVLAMFLCPGVFVMTLCHLLISILHQPDTQTQSVVCWLNRTYILESLLHPFNGSSYMSVMQMFHKR